MRNLVFLTDENGNSALKEIGNNAFSNVFANDAEITIDLPVGLDKIGKKAFYVDKEKTKLTVRVPYTVTSIAEDAFDGVTNVIMVDRPVEIFDESDNNTGKTEEAISNINTTGYKTSQHEFKSLLYQELQSKTTSANGDKKPINSQVGLGVRPSSITTIFTQGSFYESTNNFAFAIEGDGFFAVQGRDGNTYYTRNGNFQIAIGSKGLELSTTDGEPVLDTKGKPIIFDRNMREKKVILLMIAIILL